MGQINEIELKKQIKNKMFERVYLIYGPDSYLKQHYAGSICSSAVGKELTELNLSKIDGKNLKINDLADEIEQLPVLSEKRCVLVNDYDIDQKSEAEISKLKELLSDLPNSCVLVFWCDTVEINYKRPGKWKSIITLINKNGATVEFAHKDTAALTKILIDSAARRKVTMDAKTASYMISICGNDMQNLQTELDKLCAYKKNGVLLKDDIDTLASKSIEATSFQLSKLVLSGNTDASIKLIDDLFSLRVEPFMILAALITSYVDVYRVKAAISAGLKAVQIADDFGYKGTEFRLRNAAPIASKMSVKALRQCLDVLDNADMLLKSSPIDNRIIIEQAVIRLAYIMRGE